MTRKNYLQLKADLKDLASKIRPVKIEYNQSQKEYSLFQNQNGSYRTIVEGYVNPKMDKGYFSDLRQKCIVFMNRINNSLNSKLKMKHDYRHLHIVYCLARGRTMEQIEQKVREGNEPSKQQIKSIKEKYGFDQSDPDPMILEDNLLAIGAL